MHDILNDIYDHMDELLHEDAGELDFVASIKGELMQLDTLISSFHMNKYSQPSIALSLIKKFGEIYKKFREIVEREMKLYELDLMMMNLKFDVQVGTINKEEADYHYHNISISVGDSMNALSILGSKFLFMAREMQNCFSGDYILIRSGIDISKDRNKMEKLKKDGISYKVGFKLVPKNEQLDTTKSKEDLPNEHNRGKASG